MGEMIGVGSSDTAAEGSGGEDGTSGAGTGAHSTGGGASPVRYGLWPMIFLGGVNLVDWTDMAIVRGIAPVLEDEWGINDFQIGLLSFVFVVVNAVATIPAGWLADNMVRTRIIGFTMASWSGLILLSATAINYVHLLFARAVMGIGQSFDDPATTSLMGDYYPPDKRARAFSLQQVAVFAGMGLGTSLGGLVATTLGWRWAFVLVGMPGSVLAFLAFRLGEPARGGTEATGAQPPAPVPRQREPFGQFVPKMIDELRSELRFIFGIRTMRYLIIGISALLFTVTGLATWLPIYHERYSGMSVREATAVTGGVLGLGGIIGTFFGGWLADRFLAQRGPATRIHITVAGGTICAVLYLVSFAVPFVGLRLLLQFVGILAGATATPGLRAAMLDVVPAQSRGVGASAFALCSIVLGTAMAPPVVGLISHLTGSLVAAFYITFPAVLVGMAFLVLATKTIVQDASQMLAAMLARQQQQN